MYRPSGPRFRLLHLTTRLRARLLTAGASRLVCLPIRSKYQVVNDYQTSLEEAAVRRPGRKAVYGNSDVKTEIMRLTHFLTPKGPCNVEPRTRIEGRTVELDR